MLRRHSGLLTSDFPAEGDATHQYDGAGKRRQRAAGGGATKYRWDIGWNVLNEEDSGGILTRTYVGRSAAHVDGANPSTGAWRFYVHDHLVSTRGVYDANKTPYAAFEHTPYGELYASSGSTSDITRRYTGHDWDDAAQFYYAPYRYYAPGLARWLTRDPLGMVDGPNVYGYVGGNPLLLTDPKGLSKCNIDLDDCIESAREVRDDALGKVLLGVALCVIAGTVACGVMCAGVCAWLGPVSSVCMIACVKKCYWVAKGGCMALLYKHEKGIMAEHDEHVDACIKNHAKCKECE